MHTLLCCLPCSSLYCINIIVLMNPCPCGFFPDMQKCTCTLADVKRYLSKVSGPVMDRIDICVEAPKVGINHLTSETKTQSSKELLQQIEKARKMQKARYENTSYSFNAELPAVAISKYCPLGKQEKLFLEKAFQTMDLSARAYHKIIRVARTLADLDESEQIKTIHLAEAVSYRTNGGKYWKN